MSRAPTPSFLINVYNAVELSFRITPGARTVDRAEILERFANLVDRPDADIDLARAALHVAMLEYPDMDVDLEISALRRLAGALSDRMPEGGDPLYSVNTLSEYLFDELGFRGDEDNYYDPRNSHLNQVLERRVGIPITLSLVYMEVGRLLNTPLLGIGMPGRFLVRHAEVDDLFVDPFHGGILLSGAECRGIVEDYMPEGFEWHPALLAPVSNRDILARMVRNLKAIYMDGDDYVRALEVSEFALALNPDSIYNRRDRGIAHYQLGHSAEALDDLVHYLEAAPADSSTEGLHALVAELRMFLDDG